MRPPACKTPGASRRVTDAAASHMPPPHILLLGAPATVAPGGHVSPEREQVSSPGSCSSTHLEEHDDEDDDDDATAIDTEIQSSEHEEVPIETVLPPNRPSTTTYDAIVASEGKIVEAENRRHSDLMTVLERMIALQEETISQLAHLHRVFIEVPKQLQKINTSFEALVVQQTQANYLRMTTVPHLNFNTSQAGSLHAGNFSPHASELHSPGPNVTAQVADIAVQVPDDILPLPYCPVKIEEYSLDISSIPAPPQPARLLLPVSLSWGTASIFTQAFVDSGATWNFIDHTFVELHSLPLHTWEIPVAVVAIDGRPLIPGTITLETKPLLVSLGALHKETL
ncbi:uncharacterized protein LOC142492379 [Ascaphus truei]|uniref:uncharacterized protein LOC142492379 n=1 Tax=Ascaphus truei TaxID=8439 RepID=UPI003F59382B